MSNPLKKQPILTLVCALVCFSASIALEAKPLFNNQDIQLTLLAKIDSPVVPPPVVEEKVEPIICGAIVSSAEPVGGFKQFYRYIRQNLKYPAKARRTGIDGRVYVQFFVEKDGSIVDVKVLKGLGSGCDEEAMRLVKAAPKWIPEKHRGSPVKAKVSIPIPFVLR